MNLNDKTVVITGGCGQVGYSIGARLSQLGATVVAIVRRDIDDANRKMQLLSPNCYAVLADVKDISSLERARDTIKQCDILINCAGYTRNISPVVFDKITDDIFDEIINTNLKGTFNSIKTFSPLINHGVVVNISSTSGMRASQSNVIYGAAKAGIDLMTKSLAKALAPRVRIVGIAPGYLVEPTSGATKLPDTNQKISEITPMKRIGEAEDIAQMVESVIFNKHLTGQTIVVDGGISL